MLFTVSAFQAPELEVDCAQVVQMVADNPDVQVIDVRETYEREAGYMDGSRHIELERLASQAPTIDQARPVVFYCRLGARSAMAAKAFRASGYDAYSMAGGLTAWVADSREIVPENGYVADH
jgi:rhodanese-related sulfurtransferase